MGREIFYCHACGNRILEDDLRKGRALVFLDKVYCQDCKGQAFEQLNAAGGAAPAAPVASAPAEARPAAAPAKPGVQPGSRPTRIRSGSAADLKAVQQPSSRVRSSSSAHVQLPKEAPAPKSKLPLLVASIVGFVVLCVVLGIQMSKGGQAEGTSSVKPTGTVAPSVDPVYAAIKSFDEFMATKATPEAILEQCNKIEALVKGTPYAERIARIKKRAQEDIERSGTLKTLDETFAKVRQEAEADMPGYAKYVSIKGQLMQLYSSAGMDYPDRAPAIKDFMEKYTSPYEAEAQGVADKVAPVAQRLAQQEHRPKDAVKYIDDNFPERLRGSRAWVQLKTQRDRYAYQEEDEPQREPEKQPSSWKEYFERASASLQSKDYRAALDDYLAGAKLLPADLSKLGAQDRGNAILGKYNIACIYFIQGATAGGDAKKKANDSGFEWLFKTGADGIFSLTVPGEDGKPIKAADFIAKDPDLEPIRKDPRYEEFLKKYKK